MVYLMQDVYSVNKFSPLLLLTTHCNMLSGKEHKDSKQDGPVNWIQTCSGLKLFAISPT